VGRPSLGPRLTQPWHTNRRRDCRISSWIGTGTRKRFTSALPTQSSRRSASQWGSPEALPGQNAASSTLINAGRFRENGGRRDDVVRYSGECPYTGGGVPARRGGTVGTTADTAVAHRFTSQQTRLRGTTAAPSVVVPHSGECGYHLRRRRIRDNQLGGRGSGRGVTWARRQSLRR
jgi:hypothetical protein